PVYQTQVRRSYELQPDRHGQDHRADPRPAADEPARPVGNADAELFPGTTGSIDLRLPAEPDPARRDEQAAGTVEGQGTLLGEEVDGAELRGGRQGGRGHAQPRPVACDARV